MIVFDGIIFSLQQWGGISAYFNELINNISFSNITYQVRLFGSAMPWPSEAGLDRINYHIGNKRYCERYRRCQVPERTKLFHSSYYRLPDKNVPVVTTVHDFIYEKFLSGPRRLAHSCQKYKAICSSNAIICISENTRKDLFEHLPQITPELVNVIHLGVSESFMPLNNNSNSYHRPFALFVGARNTYKNFNLAVESVSRIRKLDFVCVGGGDLKHHELVMLNKMLPNRWRHEKFVSENKLNHLYNSAICLLYPSSYEGFGIPVLEAMRAGCPVIAFHGSSIPEVAGEAALLFDTLDPLALVEMIHRSLDVSERDRLRRLGFMQASLFSWKRTFENTIRVYEKVLGQSLLQ